MKKNKIAIIGNPLSHSLSPAMQNAAFKKMELPFHYSKVLLTATQLPSFLKRLKTHPDYVGLNVTVPYKEKVIPCLDEISGEARLIGAVNTILIQSGRLRGFNTDGEGYVCSLTKEMRFSPRKKCVVILGAGGASRAILATLCLKGVREIILINRTGDRAKKLAKEFQKKFRKIKIEAFSFSSSHLPKLFKKADLLINTTPAGLKDKVLPPIPLNHLPSRAIVSDIVYRPLLTPLLKKAKKLGFKIHPGWGMLLYQGALAFQIWTHKNPPLSLMKKTLLRRIHTQ